MRTSQILTATLAVAIGLSACAAPTAEPTRAPAAVAPTMVLPTAGTEGAAVELPASAPLSLGVSASGEIAPRRTADLVFRVPGTVDTILVEEGMLVQEGQELARLDLRELDLQVKQAEAGLAQAQANYARLEEGASAEEIAAAQAQVTQAQAALRQTRAAVSEQDIIAAEAALQQALARQAEVRGGPKSTDLTQAQSAVDQARANLDVQQTNLSAAKSNAELQVETAANALRDAQQAYSDRYWANRNLEAQLAKFDRDLPEELQDAEEQLLRQVQNAEARLEQTRLGVEQARQNEIDGLAAARAQLRSAEAQLQRVLEGPTSDLIAGADAAVAQARANLDRLRGDQRAAQVAQAQAGVTAAQANLDRVAAGANAPTLAGALAQVQQAEALVETAKLNRDKAILLAPFSGIVANISIDPGDSVGQSPLAAIQVVDISELRVEVNISDTDVARVREGQIAEVRVDAVPDQVYQGTVTFIAPTATVVGNIRTYTVRIVLDNQDGLRAGMSARVNIRLE